MLWKLIRTYLRPHKRLIGAVVALQLIGTIASLYLPTLNADIIDHGIAKGDPGYILGVGAWMLLVTAVQIACSITAVYAGARAAMGFGRDVRSGTFTHIGAFSSREVNTFGAPSLITRSTNDVQQVQMLVLMSLTMMVTAPIMMVGGVVMALRQAVSLSWLMLISVPVLAVVIGLIVRRMVPQFRLMQIRIDTVNRVLREQITGVRVVRAFVREEDEIRRFAVANADLTDTAIVTGRLMAYIFPTVMLVLNLSSVAVLWFGADLVESGGLQVGSLTAFLAYLLQILMAVMMATFMMVMVPRAAVSAERIGEVLDTGPSVIPPSDPVREVTERATLELQDVTFSYPGASAPVLRGVSFRAGPGQTTAIIGSTGAGKSTLLHLIARLIDVTDGQVAIDGVDVRRLDPGLLWDRIGLVPQGPYLFSGTVRSNLQYGDPGADDAQLWRALEIAQASEFVQQMPDGLDSPIAQGGTNVSGGQRQRLSIARALVREPEIYLFDDSFSALDLGTEARLRAALRPATRDATVILVAQRVSTVIGADQIIVLENGVVAGIGTHDELLATCRTYAEIVDSQQTAGVAT